MLGTTLAREAGVEVRAHKRRKQAQEGNRSMKVLGLGKRVGKKNLKAGHTVMNWSHMNLKQLDQTFVSGLNR